jgi:fumarate reductase (CoM/CoB) subunit A
MPGGIKVDERCQSTVRNLYAIGQVQGGLFGADRLGSVSLTELFVFAKVAAEAAGKGLDDDPPPFLNYGMVEDAIREKTSLRGRSGPMRPLDLKRCLQRLMWQKVGLIRDENSLEGALLEIERLGGEMEAAEVPPFENYNTDWIDLLELQGMLRLGEVIARSALERRESRGGHVRMDYPEREDSQWLKTIVARKERGQIVLRVDPIGSAWKHIEAVGIAEKMISTLRELIVRNLPPAFMQRILQKKVGDFVGEEIESEDRH